MRRLRRLALGAMVMLCACAGGAGALRFGKDVKGTALGAEAAETAAIDPAALVIGAPDVQVRGGRITVDLTVRNRTASPLAIVVSPVGGDFPYGGQSPFFLSFARGAPVTYSGQLSPPEPPLPMQIVLPAGRPVVFRAEIELSRYTWTGAPEVELDWGFVVYGSDYPKGTIKVRLP